MTVSSVNFCYTFVPEYKLLQDQINAQEHSIDHIYSGMEKFFERIEKIDPIRKQSNGDIFNIFEFVAVDAKRRDDIRHIKNVLYELYSWVLENIEDNRERSIGIEKLEEAAMWLNKSISRRKKNGI